jgi:hypothetical protein
MYLRTIDAVPSIRANSYSALIGGTTGTDATDTRSALAITNPASVINVIAREGESAPGTFSTFGSLTLDGVHAAATMNSLGTVAFWTHLASDGENGSSVYSYYQSSGLQRVLGTGDTVTLAPGDVRTVRRAFLSSDAEYPESPGFATGLLDNGRLFFTAEFTDGSSAVLSRILVPAPSAAALLSLTAYPLLRRRR